MKRFIRFGCITFLACFLFSGCTKTLVVTEQDNIIGSWVLDNAAVQDAYGWQIVNTGLEGGVFNFFGNGVAKYSDGNTTMQGTWLIQSTNGGYYDEHGNYYNGTHNMLELHLNDAYSHSSIDLYFDDVNFGGNYFIASYFDNNYVEKYTFTRY